MSVDTPGGVERLPEYRRRILGIVEEEGADVRHTIIDHVVLRPSSVDSQLELAAHGASLVYDGVSRDFDLGVPRQRHV